MQQTPTLKGFRLSLQQARLWPMQREIQLYRSQCAVLLEGPLDVELFSKACHEVIERHAILRTVFQRLPGMDVPIQVVSSSASVSYRQSSLEKLDSLEQSARLDTLFQQLLDEPFDFAHGPLARICLQRLSDVCHM